MESIYLSYSGRNCEGVLQVMEGILAHGYALACDCMLPSHEAFQVRISRAMAEAKAVVAVMTEDAGACTYMEQELTLASQGNTPMIGVLVGNTTMPEKYEGLFRSRTVCRISDFPTKEELQAVWNAIG